MGNLVVRVNSLIAKKTKSLSLPPQLLEKDYPEIYKWINGNLELSLRSIVRLQNELGEPIIEIVKKEKLGKFIFLDFDI